MADSSDLLSLAEARVAIGLGAAVSTLDTPLEAFNTAAAAWVNGQIDGPAVVEQIATTAANTTATTVLTLKAPTDATFDALERAMVNYRPVNISGTYRRELTAVDRAAGTVTIEGETITTADDDAITVGLYADTASVPNDLKMAARAYLAWLWRIERGVASNGFDELAVPFNVPSRIRAMIPDRVRPGIA